jgi:hypothetical protein
VVASKRELTVEANGLRVSVTHEAADGEALWEAIRRAFVAAQECSETIIHHTPIGVCDELTVRRVSAGSTSTGALVPTLLCPARSCLPTSPAKE